MTENNQNNQNIQNNQNNKNELITIHKFSRFPSITISEWSNKSFSISKAKLINKEGGWVNKDNIERITLLNFYYNELLQVLEIFNIRKTIGNYEFKFEKIGDDGQLKIIIIKHYTKNGQEESKRYEMTINEYYIIKNLLKRLVETDYYIYDPKQNQSRHDTTADNNNFNEILETPEEEPDYLSETPIDDDIPF
jgi:hypothetical protein